MFEEFFPLIYAGVGVTGAVFGLKAYFALQREKIRLAAREKIDMNKPEAAIDNFLALAMNAPQMAATAKEELAKIRAKNPNADLKTQEQEIKWLELLAKYQRPLSIAAPILAPIAKRYVKGLSKVL